MYIFCSALLLSIKNRYSCRLFPTSSTEIYQPWKVYRSNFFWWKWSRGYNSANSFIHEKIYLIWHYYSFVTSFLGLKSSFVFFFRISNFFCFSCSLFDTSSHALLPTNLVLFESKVEDNVERRRMSLKPHMKHVFEEEEDLKSISSH